MLHEHPHDTMKNMTDEKCAENNMTMTGVGINVVMKKNRSLTSKSKGE